MLVRLELLLMHAPARLRELAMDDSTAPLHRAACTGHCNAASVLLQARSDPNQTDKDGATPLHNATCNGHHEMVRVLIHAKAGPNLSDHHQRPPLHKPVSLEVVRAPLEGKADVNRPDNDWRTPLSYAAERGDSHIVRILLASGGAPNLADKWQDLPGRGTRTPLCSSAPSLVWHAPTLWGLTQYIREFCSQLALACTSSSTSPDVAPLTHNSFLDVDQRQHTPCDTVSRSASSLAYATICTSPVSWSCTTTGTTSHPAAATLPSFCQSVTKPYFQHTVPRTLR
eukprot:TRINITY_DN12417_c0_g1_i1.p1 TRINITY_DN12417_c0_g1~~TRINITY_DN12417_c0_g1_i1.p1  ORF type:complete len:284 (+),score=32.04 TRINITY_DN12417_c0_g1_i1:507-1358(+)